MILTDFSTGFISFYWLINYSFDFLIHFSNLKKENRQFLISYSINGTHLYKKSHYF